MTREVKLNIAGQSEPIEIYLCDNYLHACGEKIMVSPEEILSLEVNTKATCWVAELALQKKQFWVYEGEGVQTINLDAPLFRHADISTYLTAEHESMKKNISSLFEQVNLGVALVCREEQRFLCRFSEFVNGEEDNEMCMINRASYK